MPSGPLSSHLSPLSPSCCSTVVSLSLNPLSQSTPSVAHGTAQAAIGPFGAATTALFWHGALLGSAHRGHPAVSALPKPCYISTIHHVLFYVHWDCPSPDITKKHNVLIQIRISFKKMAKHLMQPISKKFLYGSPVTEL